MATSLLFSLYFIASVLILGCHYIPPVDPCEGVTCSGHGLCVSGAENAVCECDVGYRAVGLECVAVTSDGDGDGDADGGADGDGDVDGDSDADSDDELDGSGDADADREGDGDVDAGPRCGDGERQDGEACDDGDANSDVVADACRTDCRLPWCGDGVQDSTEACDRGDENSDVVADACRTDCTLARCGDGVQDSGEACDDGNLLDLDGCLSDCMTCELVLEPRRGGSASLSGASALRALWVGDLNGDDWPDIAAAVEGSDDTFLAVWLHDGVWLPVWSTNYDGLDDCMGGHLLAAGDVDGDGDTDLVGVHFFWGAPRDLLSPFLNNGDGTFAVPSTGWTTMTPGSPQGLVLGNVDGDTRVDLVAAVNTWAVVFRGRDSGYVYPWDVQLAEGGGRLVHRALSSYRVSVNK